MKKSLLRSLVVVVILAAVTVLLFRYWLMKREVPEHARVIPTDAIAVLTLNTRELAADFHSDEHLFPEMADKRLTDEFEAMSKVLSNAEGMSGIEESADILLFVYNTGDAGFFGATIQLDDSAAFGEMIRKTLQEQYKIQKLSQAGNPVMQLDTSALIFGWSDDCALLLYPLGNQSIALVTAQCAKLLKQQKENSVLANENFREMELQSFSAGLWVQTAPLLTFTDGGSLIEAIAHDVEAYSYLANFEDGEILIRSEWLLADENKRSMIKEFAFPCDTSLMQSFVRGRFDIRADSAPQHSFANAALMKIPFADSDYAELFSGMTGDFISVAHSNSGSAIPYETYCFLLSDAAKTKNFIATRMERDSIPLTTKGWTYSAGEDNRWRMILDGNQLTITNHPQVDGRAHNITPDLAGYMAWFNLKKMLRESTLGLESWLPPSNTNSALLSEHLLQCTSTLPVQFGKIRHSEIVIRFRNSEVNGLIQTEELIRKIYITK